MDDPTLLATYLIGVGCCIALGNARNRPLLGLVLGLTLSLLGTLVLIFLVRTRLVDPPDGEAQPDPQPDPVCRLRDRDPDDLDDWAPNVAALLYDDDGDDEATVTTIRDHQHGP